MTDRNTLLATVLENPADETARLVLADLLRESDSAEDQALGRFLWGGITAASYRDEDLVEDRLFYTAQAELAAVASSGVPAQWLAALGIGPIPLTKGDWGWDSSRDRVTVRIGDTLGIFARGMLAELSLTLGDWYAVACDAVAAWPIERVTITDVPGLFFTIGRIQTGWAVHGYLSKLSSIRPVPGSFTPQGEPVMRTRTRPADINTQTLFADRHSMVARIALVVSDQVAELREDAGEGWPSPPRR